MISINIDYKKWSAFYENDSLEEGIDGIYSTIGEIPYEMIISNSEYTKLKTVLLNEIKKYKNINDALKNIKIKNYAKGEYSALIENLYFELLFSNYFKPFISSPQYKKSKHSKKIIFFSNKDWILIKKLSGEDDVPPREVAAFLFHQKFSVLNKILEKNSKFKSLHEDYSKKLKGKRRNINSLILAYEVSGNNSFNFAVASSIVGYSLTPNVDLINKTFPEFKVSKPKGRKPKK